MNIIKNALNVLIFLKESYLYDDNGMKCIMKINANIVQNLHNSLPRLEIISSILILHGNRKYYFLF